MASTAHKIKRVSDRVERAKSFLLSQFKDSPNINALVDVLVTELQELENVLNDLQDVKTLEGSYGTWLNLIGQELKVDRGNYNDQDYKTAIKIAMAKKTSSATAEDILFIVQLLTNDDDVRLENNYPYLMELTGFLFCLADSQEGLDSLADLFPVSTRVRLIQQYGKSFKFGTAGRGFGSGSTLNNLAYYKYGNTNDPRFTTVQDAIIPPPLFTDPFNINPPIVSGNNKQGDTLTTTNGDWGGDDPITFTYQWLRDNSPIAAATSPSYVITSDDLSKSLSCRVTATNNTGNSSATSNSILVDASAPPAQIYTSNIGAENIYSSTGWTGGAAVSSTSTLTFNSDGTTTRVANANTVNDAWLLTTGVGLGSDYNISYIVDEGSVFSNLAPSATHNLASNISFTKTVSAAVNSITTGLYTFTIRKISDPSVVRSRQVRISADVIDIIN